MPATTSRVAATNVYNQIHAERVRAHEKHGALGNSREDAHWTNSEWLPILMEEVGEVAHELTYDARYEAELRQDDDPEATRRKALRKELMQVAAMAAAWIDAIDRG
jgi:NTP pyrophosphatase (non-canonical NTP hydrolase)